MPRTGLGGGPRRPASQGRHSRPAVAGLQARLQYSAFCEHYRRWRQHLSLSMRQIHTPGERLFIDYAGPAVEIADMHSGEIRQAQIFVAVLGASNYTYIEATWSQQLPDWIGSHVRASIASAEWSNYHQLVITAVISRTE